MDIPPKKIHNGFSSFLAGLLPMLPLILFTYRNFHLQLDGSSVHHFLLQIHTNLSNISPFSAVWSEGARVAWSSACQGALAFCSPLHVWVQGPRHRAGNITLGKNKLQQMQNNSRDEEMDEERMPPTPLTVPTSALIWYSPPFTSSFLFVTKSFWCLWSHGFFIPQMMLSDNSQFPMPFPTLGCTPRCIL